MGNYKFNSIVGFLINLYLRTYVTMAGDKNGTN
jgi:hypothetical protein